MFLETCTCDMPVGVAGGAGSTSGTDLGLMSISTRKFSRSCAELSGRCRMLPASSTSTSLVLRRSACTWRERERKGGADDTPPSPSGTTL